jgi:chemotaxis protein MotB
LPWQKPDETIRPFAMQERSSVMSLAWRSALLCTLVSLAGSLTGCNMVPRQQLAMSQNRTRQIYEQNKALAAERQRMAQDLALAQQQNAELQARGNALQSRVDNLLNERTHLASMKNTNPMSDATTRQFEDLARRYPGFEFDPNTGVSKFQTDILFASGSDELRPDAEPMLRDFARIMNSGDATQLNILVVGHTDDTRVVKASTRAKHPDNWYLSVHRAVGVVHSLKKFGVKESRMGATGYGPHQPRVASTSDSARRQNRRVEIFVLAPNASMAGWDANTRVK